MESGRASSTKTRSVSTLSLRLILISGFVLVIFEWLMIAIWGLSGIYAMVFYADDPHTHYLTIHRNFSFHFVATIALMLALEAYRVFWRIKTHSQKGEAVWLLSEHIGYLGSWAAAFVTTLFTDLYGIHELYHLTEPHTTAIWRLEMALACWAMEDTILMFAWSIWLVCKVYAGDSSKLHRYR